MNIDPITLTLFGFPLSILANFTTDQIRSLSNHIAPSRLEKLLLDAFYTSIKIHDKNYDDYSKEITRKLKEAVKNDEHKLIRVISMSADDVSGFIRLLKNGEFQKQIAEDIVKEYSLELGNYPDLICNIIADCLRYYLTAFFNQMNEIQGIQVILFECLKLSDILDLLKKIDAQVVTKSEFDDLRDIVFSRYLKDYPKDRKKIEGYKEYVKWTYQRIFKMAECLSLSFFGVPAGMADESYRMLNLHFSALGIHISEKLKTAIEMKKQIPEEWVRALFEDIIVPVREYLVVFHNEAYGNFFQFTIMLQVTDILVESIVVNNLKDNNNVLNMLITPLIAGLQQYSKNVQVDVPEHFRKVSYEVKASNLKETSAAVKAWYENLKKAYTIKGAST